MVSLLLFFAFLIFIIHTQNNYLPTPVPDNEQTKHTFSEIRARGHLVDVLDTGVRITGSASCEEFASRLIYNKLTEAKKKAHKDWVFEISLQRPSGSFDLSFLDSFTSVYQNVTNILVRLYPAYLASHLHASASSSSSFSSSAVIPSLLISAHYDSALGTVAASDNAIHVANMIEIINVISSSPASPSSSSSSSSSSLDAFGHPLVFLFNGAEETVLQASHGFITQHELANSIGAFINLEGAGGGGRDLLFQAGPGHDWLTYAMRMVPLPYGAVIAQDIFQSGIIMSDTDFRIYRDYAQIPGMDFAFITNGFQYHTTIDDYNHVPLGTLQRSGDNLMSLIRTISKKSSPLTRAYQHQLKLKNKQQKTQINDQQHDDDDEFTRSAVFFDILGLYLVVYSSSHALMLNLFVLFVSGGYIYHSVSSGVLHPSISISIQRLASTCFHDLRTTLTAIFATASIGAILSQTPAAMIWYGNPILLYSLFAASTLYVQMRAISPLPLSHHESSRSGECRRYLSSLMFWWCMLLLMTFFRIGTAYLAMLACATVFTRIIGSLIERRVNAWIGIANDNSVFLISHVIGLSIHLTLLGQALLPLISFLVPLLGRSGTEAPSDIVVALAVSLTTVLCTMSSMSLVQFEVSKRVHVHGAKKKTITALRILLASVVASILVAPFLNAYNAEAPKRMFVQHVVRSFMPPSNKPAVYTKAITKNDYAVDENSRPYYSEAGIWFNTMDYNRLTSFRGIHIDKAVFNTSLIGTEEGNKNALDTAETKENDEVYGGWPWYLPVKSVVKRNWFIPSAPPPPKFTLSLTLTKSRLLRSSLIPQPSSSSASSSSRGDVRHRRLFFTAIGPHHMTLYLNSGVEEMKIIDRTGPRSSSSNNNNNNNNNNDDDIVFPVCCSTVVGWSFYRPPASLVSDNLANSLAPDRTENKNKNNNNTSESSSDDDSDDDGDNLHYVRSSYSQLGPVYVSEEIQGVTRDDYFVFFASGQPGVPYGDKDDIIDIDSSVLFPHPPPLRRWSFFIDVEDYYDASTKSYTMIETAVAAQFNDATSDHTTEEIEQVKQKMPEWVQSLSWISLWNHQFF